jgi:hypothetical protein
MVQPPRVVLITGCVRDAAATLRSDVQRFQQALCDVPEVRWYLVESDSEDDTPTVLAALAAEMESFRFRRLGRLRERWPERTQRLAYCRNHYLDEIRSLRHHDVDVVVIADLDGVCNDFSQEAWNSAWICDDWAVCTANQKGLYYDIWALRHPEWCPDDCWQRYRLLCASGMAPTEALHQAVHSRMIHIPVDSDWIEVDSAYGGLALYRRTALLAGNYTGITSGGEAICEHVSLHERIRADGGRIFINPRLINTGLTTHSAQAIARRLRRSLR